MTRASGGSDTSDLSSVKAMFSACRARFCHYLSKTQGIAGQHASIIETQWKECWANFNSTVVSIDHTVKRNGSSRRNVETKTIKKSETSQLRYRQARDWRVSYSYELGVLQPSAALRQGAQDKSCHLFRQLSRKAYCI